ncbi:TOBE domain-containing protein [Rubrimonas cliftonensis]|uniref:Molybdenum-pterin binding domain-containing protein n=1 Tax=Rubrimonas cliftonensis TaxID=89524 RepID=A0A1H4EFW2_9RHOB|nr:TOBE domain-containing protein [Rubrimonas cliftonensis]SEA83598.1 molybdenum-pterin binding domain-containing protein [Rubrimonas cliftonensis]
MKMSARNRFKGTVVELRPGAVNAVVKVDIGGGNIMTSVVTLEAIEELGLAVGKEAHVIVKASEVMLGAD